MRIFSFIFEATKPIVGWRLHMRYHPLLPVQRIPWMIMQIFVYLFQLRSNKDFATPSMVKSLLVPDCSPIKKEERSDSGRESEESSSLDTSSSSLTYSKLSSISSLSSSSGIVTDSPNRLIFFYEKQVNGSNYFCIYVNCQLYLIWEWKYWRKPYLLLNVVCFYPYHKFTNF
jgi:hypothetical protein